MSFWANFVGDYETQLKFSKLMEDIHLRQLEKLKEHKETKKLDPDDNEFGVGEVVDHVVAECQCSEIKNVGIYITTNNAINSLSRFVKKEVKAELEKKEGLNKDLCLALESQINSFVHAKGFFSLFSKEIYLIKDIHLIGEKMKKFGEAIAEAKRNMKGTAKKKPKKSTKKKSTKKIAKKEEGTWKKTYGYKPSRFGHVEWLRIQMRGTLAHELFHFYLDKKSNVQDMMLQEEYAYKNMVGWLRKEGVRDNEIVKSNLMWYGKTVAANKEPSLTVTGREKEFDKAGTEEAKRLIWIYDNEQKAKGLAMHDLEEDDCLLEL